MVLPKITETDPWLEEDDDDYSKKSVKKLNLCDKISFSSSVTIFAKVLTYSYLLVKLLYGSKMGRSLIQRLISVVSAHKSLSSIIFIVIISTLTCRRL